MCVRRRLLSSVLFLCSPSSSFIRCTSRRTFLQFLFHVYIYLRALVLPLHAFSLQVYLTRRTSIRLVHSILFPLTSSTVVEQEKERERQRQGASGRTNERTPLPPPPPPASLVIAASCQKRQGRGTSRTSERNTNKHYDCDFSIARGIRGIHW